MSAAGRGWGLLRGLLAAPDFVLKTLSIPARSASVKGMPEPAWVDAGRDRYDPVIVLFIVPAPGIQEGVRGPMSGGFAAPIIVDRGQENRAPESASGRG
jgi:hypothetical protein